MRAFRCPHCGYAVAFEDQCCVACATDVAFHKPWMSVALAPAAGASTMIDDAEWVRCAHWDRGCNWLVG
ncbi:MAG TPA: zinc-ribbon domain-containing protein, partial [Mycobacterium sp.]|nr:zinc-ribbon domain-containing protein [Mycobacterium sp.]